MISVFPGLPTTMRQRRSKTCSWKSLKDTSKLSCFPLGGILPLTLFHLFPSNVTTLTIKLSWMWTFGERWERMFHQREVVFKRGSKETTRPVKITRIQIKQLWRVNGGSWCRYFGVRRSFVPGLNKVFKSIKVIYVKLASTNKAARLINGQTLHHVFHIDNNGKCDMNEV
ncbi:hypothetical protein BC830DRAFT_312114 [Chytriomyces sp. MP71]|nr:hypothetical protein BC830DRAFT_312114 [Chytriomyces sp. MP71]